MSHTIMFNFYDAPHLPVCVVREHVKEVVAYGTGSRIHFICGSYSTVKQSPAEVNQALGGKALKVTLTDASTNQPIDIYPMFISKMTDNYIKQGDTFVKQVSTNYIVKESVATIAQMIASA